jgi:hypothetical protein
MSLPTVDASVDESGRRSRITARDRRSGFDRC